MSTSKYKVGFIRENYQRFYDAKKVDIKRAVNECLKNGDLTLRQEVWNLEKNIADYVGMKYCATTNSGTDALFLSLLALKIGPGDEVITVSNTFIATIQAIIHTGATPILVDVGDDEQMDVEKFQRAITVKTKVVIPVQYTGLLCDMQKILEIADQYKIHIVEDACQALGATQGGKPAGSFGILNSFSFNTAKLLGGLGDGGCVVTDSKELFDEICLLRNHYNIHQLSVDRNDYPQPEVMKWAWKSRLDNVNAAFINVKFKSIESILFKRELIALRYNKAFANLPMVLPHHIDGRVWQEYHLRIKDREAFVDYMKKNGVETLVRDSTPNHKMTGLKLDQFNLPLTEQMAREVVRLPLHEWLKHWEIKYIIETVKSFYDRK